VVIDDDDKIMSAAPAYGMICEYPLSLILRQISDSLTPQMTEMLRDHETDYREEIRGEAQR
jgi:hypothetical protein